MGTVGFSAFITLNPFATVILILVFGLSVTEIMGLACSCTLILFLDLALRHVIGNILTESYLPPAQGFDEPLPIGLLQIPLSLHPIDLLGFIV